MSMPTITDGVLLTRSGEVHRDVGAATACGQRFNPRRAATVSHVQAIVHKLPLCGVCYPTQTHHFKTRKAVS